MQPIPEPQVHGRRKALLAISGAVAAALGFGWWLRNRPAPVTELSDALGFRRLSSVSLTPAMDPFAGIGSRSDPLRPTPRILDEVAANPCAALFGPGAADSLSIAVFTDYNCPICRRFEAELDVFVSNQRNPAVIQWLELPLLGESSVTAARVALAAALQNSYAAMRNELIRSRAVFGVASIESVAERLGLDAARLRDDANGAAVTIELQKVRALAQVFEIYGTPSFALGGTVVIGALNRAQLRTLARQTSPPPC